MENNHIDDIVTVMERGQVTIPVKLREALDIHRGMKLVIKVTGSNSLILAPLHESKKSKFRKYMEKMAKDRTVYWTKQDDKRLKSIRKASTDRIKKLWSQ